MSSLQNSVETDRVLEALRSIPEVELHTKVIKPLLKAIGAEDIEYLHGSTEQGKDFKYLLNDQYGDKILEVCQVKNSPFTGVAGAINNTRAVLQQLRDCADLEVFHPIHHMKRIPDRVTLFTTYPLPEKDTANTSQLLAQLHNSRVKLVLPHQLVSLIAIYTKEIYADLAFPGDTFTKAMIAYVTPHREWAILGTHKQRRLDDFFVNLVISPNSETVRRLASGDLRLAKLSRKTTFKTTPAFHGELKAIQSQLPTELASHPIYKVRTPVTTDSPLSTSDTTPDRMLSVNELALPSFITKASLHISKSRKEIQRLSDPDEHSDLYASLFSQARTCMAIVDKCSDQFESYITASKDEQASSCKIDFALPEALPLSLVGLRNDLCLSGEAGAGKTSLARKLTADALQEGRKAVYFPCNLIDSTKANLFETMQTFLLNLIPESTPDAVSAFLASSDMYIVDGCDEAATYSTVLSDQIARLCLPTPISEQLSLPAIAIDERLVGVCSFDQTTGSVTISRRLSESECALLVASSALPEWKLLVETSRDLSHSNCLDWSELPIPVLTSGDVIWDAHSRCIVFGRAPKEGLIKEFETDNASLFGDKLTAGLDRLKGFMERPFVSVRMPICQNIFTFFDVNIPADLEGMIEYNSAEGIIVLREAIGELDWVVLESMNCGIVLDAVRRLRRVSERRPRVIVTTRVSAPIRLPRSFDTAVLMPFTDRQLQRFFRRWFDRAEDATETIDYLRHHPRIRTVCGTPIIATTVACLRENGYELPSSRTEVYEKRFDLLLDRWEGGRGIRHRNRIRSKDKLRFLASIAYRMHKKHRRRFGLDDARDVWGTTMAAKYPEVDVMSLLVELQVSNAVLQPEGPTLWSLGHLSYQEYLAAYHMVLAQRRTELVEVCHDSWWRYVALFFVGISGDAGLLLSTIAKRVGGIACDKEFLLELRSEGEWTRSHLTAFIDDFVQEADT